MPALAQRDGDDQSNALPKDRAGWVKRLTQISEPQGSDWWVLDQFLQLPHEPMRDIAVELWKGPVSDKLKHQLLNRLPYDRSRGYFSEGDYVDKTEPNPYLLDMLHLGAMDKSPEVRQTAFNALFQIAVTDFKDQESYLAWRKSLIGQPVAQLVENNCRALVRDFQQATGTQKEMYLARLNRLIFQTGTFSLSANGLARKGVIAPGLIGVRRRTARDAGLMHALATLLDSEPPVELGQKIIWFLSHFQAEASDLAPMESGLRRLLTRMVAQKKPMDHAGIWLLAQNTQDWAMELLLKVVEKDYPGPSPWVLNQALAETRDARAIPVLIAMLEVSDPFSSDQIQRGLRRLTRAGYLPEQDADWWRDWWLKNKHTFPAEVRARPIPELSLSAGQAEFSLRRRARRYAIEDDPKRSYLLLTPGLVLPRARPAEPRLTSSDTFADIAADVRPGLIVVLSDRCRDFDALKKRWEGILTNELKGKYAIALAIPSEIDPQALWPTRHARPEKAEQPILTEVFTQQIVADVRRRIPVRTDRIFLLGAGEGGLAAYACSLEPQTPFAGFLLFSAVFRSAQLPALTAARHRRYFILHHPYDRARPHFLAVAARQLLQKAGASVQLQSLPAEPAAAGAPPPQPTEAHISGAQLFGALQWLETRPNLKN